MNLGLMRWMFPAVAACVVCAAPPVATVDSSAPFLLRGRQVAPGGVSSWPVFRGDRVGAQDSPVLLSFKDGSYVLVARNSMVQLLDIDGKVALKVMQGEASYKASSAGSFVLDGVSKMTSKVGVLRLAQDGTGFTAEDAGYFAWVSDQVQQKAPLTMTYGALPPGAVTVPGPSPVSRYRGIP
jgi:hypothetical protein